MITASLVLYNTDIHQLSNVCQCLDESPIEKILVIDNSPVSFSEVVLEGLTSKIEYIYGHGNVGYGKAHNIALRKALDMGSTYHLILNPDISFGDSLIGQLAMFMDSHLDVGICMPDVVYPNGQRQYVCKLLPTPLDMIGRRLLPKKWMNKRNYRFEMHETGYNQVRNVPLLSGCFMFLRMSVIKTVGSFDDRFFMYFEDYDLIRRIRRISKTVFYPKVQIVHHHAHEHRSNWKLFWISIQSASRYFNKWGWILDMERRMINKNAFSEENIIQ